MLNELWGVGAKIITIAFFWLIPIRQVTPLSNTTPSISIATRPKTGTAEKSAKYQTRKFMIKVCSWQQEIIQKQMLNKSKPSRWSEFINFSKCVLCCKRWYCINHKQDIWKLRFLRIYFSFLWVSHDSDIYICDHLYWASANISWKSCWT